MAFRIFSSTLLRNTVSRKDFTVREVNNINKKLYILNHITQRTIFRHSITKNLEIVSNDVLKIKNREGKLPLVDLEQNRPLVILLTWMLAQRKHVNKYIDLYLRKGFDVFRVSISVKQLLWPVQGSQVVAADTVNFLDDNRGFQPILIHGFSVGGYVWGEALVKMNQDLNKYRGIIERIKGQVWDSTPDITEFSKGFPHAVFPNNTVLRKAVEKGIEYHLKTFQDTATQHYIRSSQLFHTTPVRAPALVFIAKNDPIASLPVVTKAKETWESMGMKTYMKCWDKSKHVSHFHLHRKEYIETLENFLSSLEQLNSNSQDIIVPDKAVAQQKN